MSDNFQQTVNLKEQLEKSQQPKIEKPKKIERSVKREKEVHRERPVKKKVVKKKVEPIDRVFADYSDDEKKDNNNLQVIERAKVSVSLNILKQVIIFVLLLAILYFMYVFIVKPSNEQGNVVNEEKSGWYSVKLVDGAIYYGQIENTAADPVIVKNVYYNYDQLKGEEAKEPEKNSTNIRLVKRGKETHGPEGTMEVVRSQVLFMEPMREDSKVLKAILEYEKN